MVTSAALLCCVTCQPVQLYPMQTSEVQLCYVPYQQVSSWCAVSHTDQCSAACCVPCRPTSFVKGIQCSTWCPTSAVSESLFLMLIGPHDIRRAGRYIWLAASQLGVDVWMCEILNLWTNLVSIFTDNCWKAKLISPDITHSLHSEWCLNWLKFYCWCFPAG